MKDFKYHAIQTVLIIILAFFVAMLLHPVVDMFYGWLEQYVQ